ncbi:MAG: hypothetical protein ABJM26_02430 [Anderseniella sp.]
MALKGIFKLFGSRRVRDRQGEAGHGVETQTEIVEVAADAAIPTSQQVTAQQIRYAELEAENQALKTQKSKKSAEHATDQSALEELECASACAARLAALQAVNAEIEADNEALADQIRGQQDELAKQQVVLDELEADRDNARAETETLKKKLQAQEVRIGLAREELLRSEGQIELIKDLVLRESGL